MSWAQIPSSWIRAKNGEGKEQEYPLALLLWKDHKASGIAAISILIVIALCLNEENHSLSINNLPRRLSVGVTYDKLRKMTGFARSAIARGLSILEMLGAIKTVKNGRANEYELVGVAQSGAWCKIPKNLLTKQRELSTKQLPRNRAILNAMKIFLTICTLRDNKLQTTAISYTSITKWTGVRREDIPVAMSILAAHNLVFVSTDRDYRHSSAGDDDQSHRYKIPGLEWGVK